MRWPLLRLAHQPSAKRGVTGALDTSFAEDARSLDKAATGSKHRDLVIAPNTSAHGVELLADGTVVKTRLEQFLATYASPR